MNYNSFYKNKKVVIVGAGGQIGSILAQKVSALGCRPNLIFHDSASDIGKPDIWNRLVADADIIFHLAAHEPKNFNPELDLEINCRSMLYLLEACRAQGKSPQIVFTSSSNVVGDPKKMPVDESFKDNPLTMHAIHKLAAEEYLKLYARNFNIPSITLRLASVYGPSTDINLSLRSSINKMINNAVHGSPVKLFANKDKIRDFLYIDDVADAFIAAGAVSHPRGEVYIIGSEQRETFGKVADFIASDVARRLGNKTEIIVDKDVRLSEVDMREFVANSARFKELTGWRPNISLKYGLALTVDYFIGQQLSSK